MSGSNAWGTPGNWSNGIPTSSDVAVFSQSNGLTYSTIASSTSVGGLRFVNSGSTIIQGSARSVLSLGSSGLVVEAGAGNVQIGSNATTATRVGLAIITSQTWTNNSTTALVFKEQGAMGSGTNVTNLATGATLTFAGVGNFKFAGNWGGAGGINVIDTSRLIISGSAGYTGSTTITSGTLQIGEGGTNGEILPASGSSTITNNGTLIYNRQGSITPVNSITGTGGVGIGGIAGSVVTFSPANSYTYTGGTRILSPATLVISSTASLPGWDTSGKLQVDSGATLSVSNFTDANLDTLVGTGAFVAGSTLAVSTTAASVTMSANTTGINLTKAGVNTLTLTGANTPTTTTISGGRLQVGVGGTAGSLSGNVTNSGTLAFNRSDDVTFAGTISGGGALVKDGANKLTLSASNAYTGATFVNAGTLEVAGIGSSAASIFLSDNNDAGTFRYVGTDNLSLGQQVQVGNTGSGTGSGVISSDGAGTLSFTNAAFSNTFGGATAARTLVLDGANTGANTIAGTIADNSASGPISLTKTGVGTWILGGANTYTGATSIDAGTLVVNGAIGSGPVTVASTAILGGSGTIGGSVSVLGGGIVAPGNSPGTLTVNNAFALADTSILNFELNPADATVGGGVNDLITGVTNLTLDGILNISGAGSWTTVPDQTTWRLFDYTGTLTDNALTLGTMPTLGGGQSFQIDTSTLGQVNLVVVPEPSAFTLLAGAGAAGAWVAARRARRCSGSSVG